MKIAQFLLALSTALVLAAAPMASKAGVLYSIHVNAAGGSRLVAVDATSGAVTDIGALGVGTVFDIDLATTGDGRLWGLSKASLNGAVQLLEINRSSGAVLSAVNVLNGPNTIQFAEGLGSVNGQLKIAFATGSTPSSQLLGSLSTGGVISGAIDTGRDLDALGDGGTNTYDLYAVDRQPGVNDKLYGVDAGTGAATQLATTYSQALGLHDLVTYNDGTGVMIETFSGRLYRFDLATGAQIGAFVPMIGGPSGASYNGLAREADAINGAPVPGSSLLLALGVAMVLGPRGLAVRPRRTRHADVHRG